jgi:hypothetical protein
VKLIETKTLTVAAASIEFTSIPQDGTDLVLLISARNSSGSNSDHSILFNSSTTGYSGRQLGAISSTVYSGTLATTALVVGYVPRDTYTANTFSSTSIYIPNYSSTTSAKSVSVETVTEDNSSTEGPRAIQAGLWNNNAAITNISIAIVNSSNHVIGSTFSLYKITKGSDGIVTVS